MQLENSETIEFPLVSQFPSAFSPAEATSRFTHTSHPAGTFQNRPRCQPGPVLRPVHGPVLSEITTRVSPGARSFSSVANAPPRSKGCPSAEDLSGTRTHPPP